MGFVTKATCMPRKLYYVSKYNKLAQLVVQVQYHVIIIYSLGTEIHTYTRRHTDVAGKSNFKKPGVCRPNAVARLV